MSRTNPEAEPPSKPTPEPAHEPDAHQATVELDVDHAAEDVWTALTSDEGLARWMGTGATIVPEVDGAIDVPDPATGRPRQGNVESLETGQRLDFTWWPIDDPENTSAVTIELEPTIDGTRIRVTETAKASVANVTAATATTTTSGAAWAWRTAMLMVVGVGGFERNRIRA